jgi:hypothetical protein
MKIVKRNPHRIVIVHQTRLAVFFCLVGILVFGSLGLQLWGNAPDRQAYLMLGLAAFMLYLLYHSLFKYTLVIDLLNQTLHWQRSSPLGSRKARFDFSDIATIDVGEVSSRGRKRTRPELIHKTTTKKVFPLIPSYLSGTSARDIANEINAALSRSKLEQQINPH